MTNTNLGHSVERAIATHGLHRPPDTIYVHSTNANLARTLNVLDPFAVRGQAIEEQTAIEAGFECEFDRMTR